MNFNEYQIEARKTAIYPNIGKNLYYPTLGLCGESGEVAEKIKKISRDSNGLVTPEKRVELKKELGDVLWYLSNLSSELGLSLNDVAMSNISKLKERQNSNKLHGSGDNR
jgi:NTP pyrophosphatase (non-canonical NTP hydrolase)